MVLGLEALGREVTGGADLLEHHEVVLASRRRAVGDIAELGHQGVEVHLRGAGGSIEFLDAGREVLDPREDGLLLVALGPGDVLPDRLLLRAGRLEVGETGPPGLVGREDRVDQALVLAPGALAGADEVGLVTQEADVDHGASLSALWKAIHRCRTRLLGWWYHFDTTRD